ncbi:MAG: hypothetical protein WA364_02820 [Candidatus Nitrosopolaris sp.]
MILCPCYGQKLRIREYNTGFDSTILISSEKTTLTSNSIAKMLDHTSRISKSLMYRHSYENAPIHEHDFRVIAGIENVTRCFTWNVYFCRLCGKRVNHAQIHTDRLACEKRKDRERENRIKITTHAIQLQSESKRHARNYIGITNARNCGNQIPNDRGAIMEYDLG